MAESHWKLHTELEENFKRFHREIIVELEKKTDMDVKYMTATFKRYQTDYKQKQESLDRSQTDLKKLKRKGQSKHAFKYDLKENEYLETISSRQMDMQKFIADGCREALVEEKRRFWFLAEKHCMFSSQLSSFHDKAKELLSTRLPSWQERCSNVDKVPDTVASMIQGLSTDTESAQTRRHSKNHVGPLTPPPAPPLKISPLANMFNPEPRTPLSPSSDLSSGTTRDTPVQNAAPARPENPPDCPLQGSLGDLSRSTSMSSGLSGGTKFQVKTIFPHTAGNNDTLLSFDHGDVITLLIHQEKDGWLYGELDRTQQRGWFPSSYCRPYADQSTSSRYGDMAAGQGADAASLQEEEEGDEDYEPVLLPPPDYSDVNPSKPALPETPPPQNTSKQTSSLSLTTETELSCPSWLPSRWTSGRPFCLHDAGTGPSLLGAPQSELGCFLPCQSSRYSTPSGWTSVLVLSAAPHPEQLLGRLHPEGNSWSDWSVFQQTGQVAMERVKGAGRIFNC
ncbi:hypothetical protein CCH79_00020763, partial [Gambusia affinis]